jgi:hypothetical protein
MDSVITIPTQTSSGAVIHRARMESDPRILACSLNDIVKGLVFNGCRDLSTVKIIAFQENYAGIDSWFIQATGAIEP